MPNLLTPLDRPPRGAVTLLVALAALFLLGPTAGAAAREDASTKKASKQTIVQKHISGDRSLGTSAASGDTDTPKGIKVGDGEVSVGDVYAGNGCVKAGDITVGDCDEKGSGGGGSRNGASGDKGSDDGSSEDGASDNAALPEKDETTVKSPETTPEESTTLEETTAPEETTLLEKTAGDESTNSTSPEPDEGAQCPVRPPKDAVEAEIEGTADGDTLELAEEVEGYDTVRLIGVDTPELGEAGEEGQPEPLAEEASTFTADELEGRNVLLQIGEGKADQYGRLLAYVWKGEATEDGFIGGLGRMFGMGGAELFNLKLLEEGYAEVLTIEPNDLYAGCFEAAASDARRSGIGLWAEGETTGGPAAEQYDEAAPETTTGGAPPATFPTVNAPKMDTTRDAQDAGEDPAAQEPAAERQYKRSPPPEARSPEREVQEEEVQDPETQDDEIQDPEVQDPEVQESVAPSGGDETATLRSGASPAPSAEASASPGPARRLPVEDASSEPVSVLPETGGPSLLALGAGIGAAGLLVVFAMGFLAVRSVLLRDGFGGR